MGYKTTCPVIISGDVLRPVHDAVFSSQNINIRWLYALLAGQISAATGVETEVVVWDEDGFNASLFYKLQGLSPSVESWVMLYDSPRISPAALDYIGSVFGHGFVVGFELPGILTRAFDALSIPYIDLIIHPIRYLPDIFFGVKCSHKQIQDRLMAWCASEDQYYETAAFHKAMFSRSRPGSSIKADSILVAGQTEVDRSRIRSGRIVTFRDVENELDECFRSASKIYYKPHPYVMDCQGELSALKRHAPVEVIDTNIYELLGSGRLGSIISLSSSVCFEARYWGVHSKYLYANPFLLFEDARSVSEEVAGVPYVPVFSGTTSRRFWINILHGEGAAPSFWDVHNIAGDRLRRSLGAQWGYDFLSEFRA